MMIEEVIQDEMGIIAPWLNRGTKNDRLGQALGETPGLPRGHPDFVRRPMGLYTIAPPQFRGRISKEFTTLGGWTWGDDNRMRMLDARYGHTHNPSGVATDLSSKIRGRLFRRKFGGKEYQLTAMTLRFNPSGPAEIPYPVWAARKHASNLRKMGYNARVVVWNDQAGIYIKRSQLERRIGDEAFEKIQRRWASSRGPSSDLLNTTRSIHRDSLDWGEIETRFASEWDDKRWVYSDNDPGKHHQVAVFNRKRWKREQRE